MSVEALSGRVFLLVTGASRGIGRQFAITLGSMLEEGSQVLLLATNLEALQETAKQIPSKVSVDTISVDLSKAEKDELSEIVTAALHNKTATDFDRLVLIHNVGTMADLTIRTTEMTDVDFWRKYYDLNLFLPAVLHGVVLNLFKDMPDSNKTVVNNTSLWGIQPGLMTGYYCTVKAAREMFFKVFALEYPEINVLSYSPGPVNTDMFHMLCETMGDEKTRATFIELRDKNTALTCEQTINRFVTVLKERKYKSGDHVDYYDEL